VITMEMLGKVRRMYLRDKLSLHEISKRTGLSRNTLRKWVRRPEAEVVAAPRYRRGEVRSKLTPFHAALELALTADAHRIKQNRRTAKGLFAQAAPSGWPYIQVKAMR
jgi:transposase